MEVTTIPAYPSDTGIRLEARKQEFYFRLRRILVKRLNT
jgi:hypothetical protein